VLLSAATGARFSQLAALTVADVQVRNNRIMVPSSRKGKKRVRKHIAVPVQPEVIARLRPVIRSRGANEPLLMRWSYVQTATARWTKAQRQVWRRGHEHRKLWAAAVKRAGLPTGTVMYALRHSSIVRALLKGLPVRLVAALHDTSVVMVERHYAAYITDMSEELARLTAISFDAGEGLQAAE
jgi:integrase